jgi:hypothetical protein
MLRDAVRAARGQLLSMRVGTSCALLCAAPNNHDGVTDVMWQSTTTGDIATWQFDHSGLLI